MELSIDKKRVTSMARGLEARIAERFGIAVKHADAIEILAGMFGFATSNALLAAARGAGSAPAAEEDGRRLHEITWTYFDNVQAGPYRTTARLTALEAERLQRLLDTVCARHGRILDPAVEPTEEEIPSEGADGVLAELTAAYGEAVMAEIDGAGILAGTALPHEPADDADDAPAAAGRITIPASMTADDDSVVIHFDAAPWFAKAKGKDLAELVMRDFTRCQAADDAAYAVRGRVPEIDELLNDLEERTETGEDAGFEVAIDAAAALEWLRKEGRGAYGALRAALDNRKRTLTPDRFDPSSALAHFLAIEEQNVAETLDDALDSLLQMDEGILRDLSERMACIAPKRADLELELLQMIGSFGGDFTYAGHLDSTAWNMD